MRKNIFTVFYILCFSILSFCTVPSFATPNDVGVNNAINMLEASERSVLHRQIQVNKAWSSVSLCAAKWDTTQGELRRKNVKNYVIEMMGSGFWATSGGIEGRTESEFKVLYRNLSLMDLYSDEINHLKYQIGLFKSAVSLYNEIHRDTLDLVSLHHQNFHDPNSPSNINHWVPPWEEYTCKDDLPSFSCSGNRADGDPNEQDPLPVIDSADIHIPDID